MIVYSANKRLFVQDVKSNVIATKILDLIREKGLNARKGILDIGPGCFSPVGYIGDDGTEIHAPEKTHNIRSCAAEGVRDRFP